MSDPVVGIKYTPLSELRRWPRNPKLHDLDQIEASIVRHGFIDPIVLDARSGMMVAGHGRDETLERMKRAGKPPPKRILVAPDGEWLVPVLTGVEFESETDAEAYIIGSNRLVEMGGWDEQLLQDIVATEGFDALGTGLQLDMPDLGVLLDQSGLDPAPAPEDLQLETKEKGKFIKVGKLRVPVTDDELRALVARLERFEEETGDLCGFFGLLLKQRG